MKMMMKKLFIFFLLALLMSFAAAAVPAELDKTVSHIMDGSFANDPDFAANAADSATNDLKPQNIFMYMLESIKAVFSGSYRSVFLLLAVVFIAALTEVFAGNLGTYSGIIDYVSLLALMLICFNMTTPLIVSVTDFLDKHAAFMMSVTGTSSALLAASGSAGSAAASSVSAAFITSFTEICSVNIILPAVKVIIVLSSVSAISRSMDLSGVINFLKSFCSYGTGLLFAVFLAVHSFTLTVSSSADSLAFRSLRFTASRLIPVAGGMISESIKTVIAGMNMIKSAAGGIGIAYIIYTAIPSVFLILSVKTAFLCTLTVSKIFGVRRHASFLEGLNGAFNLLLAISIFAAFGGIIILAVFMNTSLEL